MECAACQAPMPEGARFCNECGSPASAVCAECGAANPPAARFCSNCGKRLGANHLAPIAPVASTVPSPAERRQLSVMFCDMVGSTELSSQLDPEDLSEVMRTYLARITETIKRFDGFIARYMGDGVKCYFGWPIAHETDAERAIRAALACLEETATAPIGGEPVRTRIGIATGLVVVGESIGSGVSLEQTAVGETPNRAARLQGLADPGGVVIDIATRRQVGDLFDCHSLGAVSLKGLRAPVEAFKVIGARAVQSRFEAMHAARLTPLIGRNEELDLLLRRWEQAKRGEGRVVLVAGEPGIGKSRLLAALDDRLHGETLTRMRYFCSPHHTNTPLYPVIRQLEFAAGFVRADAPSDRLRKLRAILELTATSDQDVVLLAQLLSLPVPGAEAHALSAQRRKELTFEALINQVERLAARQPVLLLFEDLHWSDASTLELLDLALSRLRLLPSLFIATFRPDFNPPWTGQSGTTLLTLSRLGEAEASLLACQVTLSGVLPTPLLRRVVAQADGVPLFIEELTKAVLESRLAPDTEAASSVPETLHASLLARLDRLPRAKQVAQIGSVIGREFSYHLLRAVSELPDTVLAEGLDQLVASGLGFVRGTPPTATYSFKHALVQDAAYDSLLRGRRVSLHAAIAAALERDPDAVARRPGLIGHHYAQAEMAEPATAYLFRAGEEAGARSAMAEAHAHLMRGLAVAEKISDPSERNLRRAKLTLGLVNVTTAVHGFGTAEQALPVSEAVALCRAVDPAHIEARGLLARALFGDWTYKAHVGRLEESLESASDLRALGSAHADPEVLAAGIAAYGTNCFLLGRLEEGYRTLKAGIDDPGIAAHSGAVQFSIDARSLLHAQLSRVLAARGYPEDALAQVHLGVEGAKRVRHLPSVATNLTATCLTAWMLRDDALLEALATELCRLTSEAGFAYWLARSKGYLGWIAAMQGRHEDARQLLREAIAGLDQRGIRLYGPDTRVMLADVHARTGESEAARALLAEALAISEHTGEAWVQPELHRRLAQAELREPATAEARFLTAIELAQRQSARLFNLRATTDLARLLQSQGRHREAHARLAPAYACFGQGLDLPDLVEARVLLGELTGEAAGTFL
ncbi:MAG TPA: AAA family ATPase [Acetobacteraceae bacterium]|nr:AAA family ATPase [Acetobacteraceae bacterium]